MFINLQEIQIFFKVSKVWIEHPQNIYSFGTVTRGKILDVDSATNDLGLFAWVSSGLGWFRQWVWLVLGWFRILISHWKWYHSRSLWIQRDWPLQAHSRPFVVLLNQNWSFSAWKPKKNLWNVIWIWFLLIHKCIYQLCCCILVTTLFLYTFKSSNHAIQELYIVSCNNLFASYFCFFIRKQRQECKLLLTPEVT